MSQFELLFGFYGLLLGLGVAELAGGFSRVYDRRSVERIGGLGPGLAALLICDLLTFWLAAWRFRDWSMDYTLALAGSVIGLTYYFAASQVFPREGSAEPAEARAFSHRRVVVICLGGINLVVFVIPSIARFSGSPSLGGGWNLAVNLIYIALLAWIYFARSQRRAALATWTTIPFLIFVGANLELPFAAFIEELF